MTSADGVTEDEQRKAVERLVRLLAPRHHQMLLLGSVAILYKSDHSATTKDVDLHITPTTAFIDYYDMLRDLARELQGPEPQIATDGSSITLQVPVDGLWVPVEIIQGGDDFIAPEVLEDAVRTADTRRDVYVPSWEHLLAMKAEAWFDRTGPQKTKFLEDMVSIRDRLKASGEPVSRQELYRIVGMRPRRKQSQMLSALERILGSVIGSPASDS